MVIAWKVMGLVLLSFSMQLAAKSSLPAEIRLLNNRFRIDETINQAAFIIYRAKPNQPVILVRPDGEKIYAKNHPPNVFWQQEKEMDIITVLNPQSGPWQAIGRVSAENKIQLLSDLKMKVDVFPERLYQGESIKFSVRLIEKQQPLKLRDYLDNIKLDVNFTEYVDNLESLPEYQRPKPWRLGRFFDDGKNLDELAADGVFTVDLPIDIAPGKYRVTIESSNDIFFRSLEQIVLVYPYPLALTFSQSRKKEQPHKLLIELDDASFNLDNVFVHAEFTAPSGKIFSYENSNLTNKVNFITQIDNFDEHGQYFWTSWIYGIDALTQRALVFKSPKQSFVVTNFSAIEKATREQAAREKQRLKIEQEEQAKLKQQEDKKIAIVSIIGGNIFILILAAFGWFAYRFFQKRKEVKRLQQLLASQEIEDDDDDAISKLF